MTQVWNDALEKLKMQMTRATFDSWLQGTQATRKNDALVIHTKSASAKEWLEKRLDGKITDVLTRIDPGIESVIYGLPKELEDPPPNIELSAEHRMPYTATVKPNKIEAHTQYFRRKWRPLLGPLYSELVRELRQRCYYGRGDDKEKRFTVDMTRAELAAALGVSLSTINRALKRKPDKTFVKNRYLHLFITEIETVKVYDDKKKRVVNDHTKFTIMLDEPPAPGDFF